MDAVVGLEVAVTMPLEDPVDVDGVGDADPGAKEREVGTYSEVALFVPVGTIETGAGLEVLGTACADDVSAAEIDAGLVLETSVVEAPLDGW